jgi:Na+/H+ antiporter NhaD/arsenite permease-like protein
MLVPFGILLAAIALAPLFFSHWWEKNYAFVAVGLSLVVVAYYGMVLHAIERVGHSMIEYVSFISIIGTLYVVAGGIQITVKGQSTPLVNVLFLGSGSVVANIIGTTGASMLLIRPWMRMNRLRYTHLHTVFFIFIISNTAGCLTPIGDPPLFLGYLKGIPFLWELENLWLPWLLTVGSLLFIFWVLDVRNYSRLPSSLAEAAEGKEKFVFRGALNAGILAVILAAVFLETPIREVLMVASGAASWYLTPREIHKANDFSFGPIKEVAWLFLGIFVVMVPALDYLSLHAEDFGLNHPIPFYFLTGALSSVLDNAPTYLTFLTTAISSVDGPGDASLSIDEKEHVLYFLAHHSSTAAAISLGAVFFGAMTYIGNGPNLLVKAIVDRSGFKTPHFLEYIYRYSLPILLPVLTVVGWWFLA